jgi:hypothetical protein
MACDRALDRALLLSLGLFGAPAAGAERDRKPQLAENLQQAMKEFAARDR